MNINNKDNKDCKSIYLHCRHLAANKLEGDWIVLMDHFVARDFDLVVWNYSVDV